MIIMLDPDCNCDKLPQTEWLQNKLYLLQWWRSYQNGLVEGSRRESVCLPFLHFWGSSHSLVLGSLSHSDLCFHGHISDSSTSLFPLKDYHNYIRPIRIIQDIPKKFPHLKKPNLTTFAKSLLPHKAIHSQNLGLGCEYLSRKEDLDYSVYCNDE